LIKTENGLLALTGNNTYTGGVFINSGTLQINSDNSLGDPSNNVTFSGTSGNTLQLTALSGTLTSNRNFTVTTGTGNVDTNGNVLVLNGGISGPGVKQCRTGTID